MQRPLAADVAPDATRPLRRCRRRRRRCRLLPRLGSRCARAVGPLLRPPGTRPAVSRNAQHSQHAVARRAHARRPPPQACSSPSGWWAPRPEPQAGGCDTSSWASRPFPPPSNQIRRGARSPGNRGKPWVAALRHQAASARSPEPRDS